ncbi:MAG: hypothetical protein QM733_22815 [Ilumatobacteraceae bacterium]
MTTIALDLELIPDSTTADVSHVRGSLSVQGSPRREFVGWAELLALLEASLIVSANGDRQAGSASTHTEHDR